MQRQTRREMKRDEFVDGTMQAIQRVQANPTPYLTAVAAVVLIVVVAWAGIAWFSSRSAAASDALARGLAAKVATIGDPAARETPSTPYDPVFETADARFAAATERLSEAASGGGAPARVAGYLHGLTLLEAGQIDRAVEELGDAARSLGSDPSVGGAVRAAHASALGAAGRHDEAVAAWRELAEADAEGAGYPKDLALEGLARAQEAAGDSEGARATYQRVIDLYPNTGSATSAEERLEILGG